MDCPVFFSNSFVNPKLQTNRKRSGEGLQNSIPHDTALKITSYLEAWDVCSLGSCSRFWRELCGSDCVWEALYRERWPALDPQTKPSLMGWRECYIDKHKCMDRVATDVVQQFSCAEAIEVGQYLSAIEGMSSTRLGFKDVQMFFFKPNLSALINLIGVHYCISWLGVPVVTPTMRFEFPYSMDTLYSVGFVGTFFPECNFYSKAFTPIDLIFSNLIQTVAYVVLY